MSLIHSDQRIAALTTWLAKELLLDIQKLEVASSDASFRRYFRVTHQNQTQIVMDAPPDKENIEPFLRIARLFKAAKIPVPDIYQANLTQGFILLEDFGNRSLLESINLANATAYYQTALTTLQQLQTGIDIQTCGLPAYDIALLTRELMIFHEWFLEKLLSLVLPVSIKQALHDLLIESALQQPQVCVHRDYHSRNLMVINPQTLGVIDFQDAVIGPLSYDPVSLLRDCYIRWSTEQVETWLAYYYQRACEADLLAVGFAEFKRWFDLMGLQRHLKAIGIFSRLHLRDGKPGYLADIPRTIAYVMEICEIYPELTPFKRFLQLQVLPIYQTAL